MWPIGARDIRSARVITWTIAVAVALVVTVGLAIPVVHGPAGGDPFRSGGPGLSVPSAGAALLGSRSPQPVSLHPVVGAASDRATDGYWEVASDGGVFSFDAPFFGSAGALPLVRPIVGVAATPDGGGYWLVASDGGVFSFGDARFFGSMGGTPLNRPVVGVAATPDGGGYWLVASDGGVFSFGDAPFLGSTGAITLARPVVGMAADPNGGYWLVAEDGGIFSFGGPFEGSAAGSLARAAVGLSVSDGGGYRVVSANGSLTAFGGAPLSGSADVPPLAGETVAIDPGHDGGNAAAAGVIAQPIDDGNGTESCDTVGTETATGYPEHAFNFDVASRLATLLRDGGATVVMTRTTDTGVGPCVDTRAAIGNDAHADAAVSIHADGGPVSGRGFDVIEPLPVVGPISDNAAVVPSSEQLGADVRTWFAADTGEGPSDYSGSNGIDQRDNLGGLNLTTVPKVLIECANMQNPADAALTESASWRQQAAQGLADGITAYLVATERP